jgi:hypothetical protein
MIFLVENGPPSSFGNYQMDQVFLSTDVRKVYSRMQVTDIR